MSFFLHHMRRTALIPCLCAVALSLCSCLGGILDPGPAPTRLQLAPAMPNASPGKPVDKQLVVSLPVSGREVDTDRIALIFREREVRYLAAARWTSSAPELVRGKLIEALEVTGALRGVGDEISGIMADARLLVDLRHFSFRYAEEKSPPTAVFEANFRVLNLRNGKITGSRLVARNVPATGTDKGALAAAMETALQQALAEAVPWVVEEMRGLR